VYKVFFSQHFDGIVEVADEVKVGQNFIVGIDSTRLNEGTKNFLSAIKPGGIIIYRQVNIENTEQLSTLIKDLQVFAKETTGKPYFIFIDEEPAGATRLDLFEDFRNSKKINWDLFAKDIKKMSDIGINVDLAPVADFTSIENSFISKRSPSRNIEDFIAFNTHFIELMKQQGISTTLKHFPGIGVSVTDPHEMVPYFDEGYPELEQSFKIFQEGIKAGAGFIMTNHAVYTSIDPKNSASFSRDIMRILREDLDFRGIIITDDVSSMPFITNGQSSITDAGINAINAGNTMVLFSRKARETQKAFQAAVSLYKKDSGFKSLVDANYRLISDYKTVQIR
jgi:beta-N-acetylhexosaminidase